MELIRFDYCVKIITKFDSVVFIYKYKELRSHFYEWLFFTLEKYGSNFKSYELYTISFDTLVLLDNPFKLHGGVVNNEFGSKKE